MYDPAYVRLDYPGGDVPIERGVCTDVLVRSYLALGIDLQVLVNVDMRRHFSWDVDGLAHTGLVASATAADGDRHLIVHNIGAGVQLEDVLFAFPITAHFRQRVDGMTSSPASSERMTPANRHRHVPVH